jgi:hypothetical protein
MIACYENLMSIRQLDIPVQKIQHFTLCTIMANVSAMDDDISLWHVFYLMMQAVSIGQV